MALFNKLKIMGESLGKTASSMATSASNNLAEASSLLNEKSKITKLESESKGLDNEINLAYSQIGKKLVDYILKTGEVPNIGIEDILSKLDPKLTRKQEIEKEIIKIEKIIKDAQILQEKAKYSEQFEQEIQKLDKALNMGIITKEEYDSKSKIFITKLENFDEVRRIEQQFNMGIITKEEKEEKLNNLI